MSHDNDYNLEELIKIEFEGMPYWVMPRYVHHYVHNAYEKFSLKLIKNLIKKDDTFLDIGAHYGAYSIYAAQKCESKVISLEPVNENYKIFGKNIAANGLEKLIEAHNVAASDEDTEAEFNIPWASDSAGFYDHPLADTFKKQKVVVKNVDKLIGNRKVDFIKIDTEGHELTVLKGLRSTLAKNPSIKLLIEANPTCLESAGRTVEELLHYLAYTLNKELYVVDEDNFTLKRITNDIDNWDKYINGYANVLCLPKKGHQFALFVCHGNELGGAERSMVENIEALRSRGIESHAIVTYDGPLRDLLITKGISNSVVTYGFWTDAQDFNTREEKNEIDIEAAAQISRIASSINPTVVVNNSLVAPWGIFAARYIQVPLVWFVQEFGDIDHGFKFRYPIEAVRRYIAEESDLVICCSNAVQKTINSKNALTIYPLLNGSLVKQLASEPSENIFSTSNPGQLRIVFSGRIQASKGQLVAVNALAKLKKKKISAELAFIGSSDEKYLKILKREVKQLGLDSQVNFLGYQANPHSFVKQADVALVCSENEAFGRVTAEAMLVGTPVVATHSGGTIELVEDNVTGMLFKPGDAADLANKLISLTDPKLRNDLSKNALKHIDKLLNPEVAADKLFQSMSNLDYRKNRVYDSILFSEVIEASNQAIVTKTELRKIVADHIQVREELEQELSDVNAQNAKLREERSTLLNLNNWKLTKTIRKLNHKGKRGVRKAINYSERVRNQLETNMIIKSYSKSLMDIDQIKRSKGTTVAVIVHLFYPETWPAIKEKLAILNDITNFDLFITVPVNGQAPHGLQNTFKNTHILRVPNRGRDVLPFIMLAPHLQKLGYKSFLKLHSKRSTHRTDGEDWFSTILNGLVPSDKSLVKATLAKLDDPKTGIICPENQYVSLRVNYRANQHHVNGLIADATSEVTQRKLDSNVGDYGFAAGTMFWARFDAIKSLLSRYTARNFETEQGQIDGTFAHALERVFTVLPELNGLNIYEIGESSLERIQYDSGIVPDWSDIHKPRG